MNKQEALDFMQKLIGEEFSRLADRLDESMNVDDFYNCDVIHKEREHLVELFNFLEKEYRGE